MKKCDCGNTIEFDEDQCDWCEYPEPMYLVKREDSGWVTLFFLGTYQEKTHLHRVSRGVSAVAPSKQLCQEMIEDFINNKTTVDN